MFRLLAFASLMAAASAANPFACTTGYSGSSPGFWNDGYSCVTCSGSVDNGDGTRTVTIDGSSCKCEDTLSWMCCISTDAGACGASTCGANKCNGVNSVSFKVPFGATSMAAQIHDGQVIESTAQFTNNNQDPVCKSGTLDTVSTLDTASQPVKVCDLDIAITPAACGVRPPADTCDGTPGGGGGAGGDPHIRTWEGQWFDFSGECDLVLASAPAFAAGLGLDVHIRTKIRYDYSYISNAALRIGDEVFEVASLGDYLLNGVSGVQMPASLAGFPVSYTKVNDMEHAFSVELGHDQYVRFKVFKDLVTVKFEGAMEYDFAEARGLMGDFNTKELVGRNGTAVSAESFDEFAQGWQVTDMDGHIFASQRAPQYPAKCIMPEEKVNYGSFLRFAASAN